MGFIGAVEDRVWNNHFCSDSPYPIFWNEGRGLYSIMTRPQQAERRIARIDTEDFLTYSGPHNVLSPDPLGSAAWSSFTVCQHFHMKACLLGYFG